MQNFGRIVSFIFNIANDCLVDKYDVGDYRKIILPMMVIRRLDALLVPTKQKVLDVAANQNAIAPELCKAAGQAFYNTSPFTLESLKSITQPPILKENFLDYLNGFSENVREIIDKFGFFNQIDKLAEYNIIGELINKFTDPDNGITQLDNHSMGTVFEEVIRRFNEETNVTDAGRHFTPRDIVRLVTDLAFLPIKDKLTSTTYRIYDGACGTGGMLTAAEERIKEIASELGIDVSIFLYGQEVASETYAIAKSDMLIKQEDPDEAFSYSEKIKFGSTIADDKLKGYTFDFMLSNPPFGTPWKTDFNEMGGKKENITDPRFIVEHNGKELSLLPDIGDAQLLFLANNISRVKTQTKLGGSRIVEIHNGSSLFTGKAGQGASNLRQYIIENDFLEAVIALPERMFYNTGIKTYIWVLSNNKEERRKNKVQLIDASSFVAPLRKNLGEKTSEITPEIREKILKLYDDFEEAERNYSVVLDGREFGFWEVNIHTPEEGKIIAEKEIIPFTYPGGIDGFLEREVKPYAPGSFVKKGTAKIGYEISFTKYFYRPEEQRTLKEIAGDILNVENEIQKLTSEVFGGKYNVQ